MAWNKPLPNVDRDHEAFWDALKEHKFVLFRCKRCSAWYWPVSYCRNHKNEPLFGNMEWAEASGRGKVFAFNVFRWAFTPEFESDLPYVYALIELEEGPLFSSNIVGCDPSQVKIGMPVKIQFRDITEEYTLPLFQPAG